ncbi:hypothetical protein VCR15J2_390133 [Vibrio coralliirubri]|uniref:hypothetical protein n=1 Tax=Vibrio coralliirubri TaxID=1516159 RepID=UPI0006325B7C|nr:hypothetical protein [Vibrio coralliirubri]CDT54120.1 hypothetical protein VCR15J2_390133 [Vibrio coralliirubri]
MEWETINGSSLYAEIRAVHTPDRMVSKFTFEGLDRQSLFEGHWWKKHNGHDASIYLSTHSGCPVGCRMCGTNGIHLRPATANELIAQFEEMIDDMGDLSEYSLKFVKWMYMGEPLLNVVEVDKAMRYIVKHYPDWMMLVSSIGPLHCDYDLVKGWQRDFGERLLLSFSIHKMDYIERNNLIPLNDKLTMLEIVKLGKELFDINPTNKLSFSYNIFNKEQSQETAELMLETFDPDVWIPCIQFLYSKNGTENPDGEKAANLLVDQFCDVLRNMGYDEVLPFYGPMTSGDNHLVTGCGQFVEFQKYVRGKKREHN